jgi:hypothetical protein
MWHTPEGERVLRGDEGRIFQHGAASLLHWIDEMAEALKAVASGEWIRSLGRAVGGNA